MKFTKSIKPEEVKRDWILIDAKNKTFGRLITEIATIPVSYTHLTLPTKA